MTTKKKQPKPEPGEPAETIESATPTLPGLELPDYHGRAPVGMRTSLNGAGSRVSRAHSIGDRVVLVIEARVKSSGHEDTDDGIVYVEKLKVSDLFEVGGDNGRRLIQHVRSLYRTAEDAVKGRAPLPDLGEVGYTDENGVVLTPKEVAERRGDVLGAFRTEGDDLPAVIVYDDGSRDLWPDDHPKDTPRPKVGEKWTTDRGDLVVVELLNHETGEPITAPPPPPAGEVPALPEPEAEPEAEWETPDRRSADELEAEATLPTSADLKAMDVALDRLPKLIGSITDVQHLRRLRRAEEQGRGKAAAPRVKALALIDRRLEALPGEQ